jgi:urease accessory protein
MKAQAVAPPGTWSIEATDTITLDHAGRHRRRVAMTSDGDIRFLLDLPEATCLRDGDGLVLEDGRIVEVRAMPEELLEVRGADGRHLARLAWHLGNRHLAAQIEEDRILIRRDHVIAHLLEHQGARVRETVEPFDPETGAYDHSHAHDR